MGCTCFRFIAKGHQQKALHTRWRAFCQGGQRCTLAQQGLYVLRPDAAVHAFILQPAQTAQHHLASAQYGLHATARHCCEVFGFQQSQVLSRRHGHYRTGQGMLAAALYTRGPGQGQNLILPRCHHMAHQSGLSYGERARFVKGHGLHLVGPFQGLDILDQDAVFGRHARSRHDGHGCGQTQRTGAGDHQHRHRMDQCRLKACALKHPHRQRDHGHHQHHGHKDFGHFVDQPLNGRFGGLCVFHQTDDVRQHRFVSHRRDTHHHTAVAVDRASRQACPHPLVHGQRLTCQHGLVHLCLAFDQFAVQRKALTRTNHDAVVHQNFCDRYVDFTVSTEPMGLVRPQRVQRPNGLGRLAFGTGLQPFAQHH